MKQRIFIVDAPPENKFTKFTQNFEEFSVSNVMSPPISTPYESPESAFKQKGIADLVHGLTLISLRPSQISGQFIFSISSSPERKYKLTWCSLGTIAAFIRAVAFFFQTKYYKSYSEQIIDRFGIEHGSNSTLSVTELILSLTIFISDFIGSFLFWKSGNDIQSFLNRLNETVTLFAEDIKGSTWIHEWFKQMTRKTRRLVWVIHISTLITTVLMAHKDIYKIFLYLQGESDFDIDSFTWTFPLFVVGWFIVLFQRLHFRLWLMTIIDIHQFGFQIVKEQIRLFGKENEETTGGILRNSRFVKREVDLDLDENDEDKHQAVNSMKNHLREMKLTQILEKYRTMEQFLEDFNELFAPHLLIGIMSIVVVMLMALFHFFVDVNYKLSCTSSIFALEAVVYTLVLFSMGTAATDMASEADACITALRDVPLGSIHAGLKQKIILHFQHAMAVPLAVSPGYFFSLNRKMLTSVAGTLTTYLIVLIQFQTNEKPALSGGHNSSVNTST